MCELRLRQPGGLWARSGGEMQGTHGPVQRAVILAANSGRLVVVPQEIATHKVDSRVMVVIVGLALVVCASLAARLQK
jgi:hypothetical protein